MKDIGINIGALIGSVFTTINMGNIAKFSWWQKGFMFFTVLSVAIILALFGDQIQKWIISLIAKMKKQWTGKKFGEIKYRKY